MGRAGVGGGECKESGYRAIRDCAISYEIRSVLHTGNTGDEAEGVTAFYQGEGCRGMTEATTHCRPT